MNTLIVDGDLLDQPVDAIVNAWNRNLIPWWLLLPQGISGAIKKRGGIQPFRELRKFGILSLGAAVTTSAGKLPFKGIIHVAGIGHNWVSTEASIRLSVQSAMAEAEKYGFKSVGFPLIGAGTGGFNATQVEQMMIEELERSTYECQRLLVRFKRS